MARTPIKAVPQASPEALPLPEDDFERPSLETFWQVISAKVGIKLGLVVSQVFSELDFYVQNLRHAEQAAGGDAQSQLNELFERYKSQAEMQFRTTLSDVASIYGREIPDTFIDRNLSVIYNLFEHHYLFCFSWLVRDIGDNNYSFEQEELDRRWRALEEFAVANNGIGVAAFGKQLFGDRLAAIPAPGEPKEHRLSLPQSPPETYQGLRGPETPPEFVQRVYGPWLGKGLTRATIRHLDMGLYRAINNWERKNQWPADVDLPTLKQQNDRWVDRLQMGGLDAVPQDQVSRLVSAAGRRVAGKFTNK